MTIARRERLNDYMIMCVRLSVKPPLETICAATHVEETEPWATSLLGTTDTICKCSGSGIICSQAAKRIQHEYICAYSAYFIWFNGEVFLAKFTETKMSSVFKSKYISAK